MMRAVIIASILMPALWFQRFIVPIQLRGPSKIALKMQAS